MPTHAGGNQPAGNHPQHAFNVMVDSRFTGSRVHRFTGSRVHRFTGSRVHRFTGSQVQGSRVHRFTGSRVHGFTGSQVHRFPPPREALRRDLAEARRAKAGTGSQVHGFGTNRTGRSHAPSARATASAIPHDGRSRVVAITTRDACPMTSGAQSVRGPASVNRPANVAASPRHIGAPDRGRRSARPPARRARKSPVAARSEPRVTSTGTVDARTTRSATEPSHHPDRSAAAVGIRRTTRSACGRGVVGLHRRAAGPGQSGSAP